VAHLLHANMRARAEQTHQSQNWQLELGHGLISVPRTCATPEHPLLLSWVIKTRQQRGGLRGACPNAAAVTLLALALATAGCEKVASDRYAGYARLTWTPVRLDTEGKPLPRVGGYRIYYGRDPAALDQIIDVPGADVSMYLVTDLAPGSWYFAVAAYTTPGNPGLRSNVVTKRVH